VGAMESAVPYRRTVKQRVQTAPVASIAMQTFLQALEPVNQRRTTSTTARLSTGSAQLLRTRLLSVREEFVPSLVPVVMQNLQMVLPAVLLPLTLSTVERHQTAALAVLSQMEHQLAHLVSVPLPATMDIHSTAKALVFRLSRTRYTAVVTRIAVPYRQMAKQHVQMAAARSPAMPTTLLHQERVNQQPQTSRIAENNSIFAQHPPILFQFAIQESATIPAHQDTINQLQTTVLRQRQTP